MDDVRFPGTYVVAVSGGVDSMALLDMLVKQSRTVGSGRTGDRSHLVVAHFDHGIRSDSKKDRKLVQDISKYYGVPFIYHEGNLGEGTSEAVARKARYDFLHKVRRATNARAIVTAHHQDDLLETAILQLLRGGGRRGWTALKSHPTLARPLLVTNKKALQDYAQANSLVWHEDSTNLDTRYLRNFVRHNILAKMTEPQKQQLLTHIQNLRGLNRQIDDILNTQLHLQPARGTLDRHWFINLPHRVATEVMAAWLRARGVTQIDKKLIERLTIAAKTYHTGQLADVNKQWRMVVGQDNLALATRDR